MDRNLFHTLFLDVLANIHDQAVLEKHEANRHFPLLKRVGSRSENLRLLIYEGIESLKPSEKIQTSSLEWRYYTILFHRYIEGVKTTDIQKRLSLGDRQLRRMHGRAMDVLENVLWNRYFSETSNAPAEPNLSPERDSTEPVFEESAEFQIVQEPLDLAVIVHDVIALCSPRFQSRQIEIDPLFSQAMPFVQADRIILRQILIDLFSRVMKVWAGGKVIVSIIPDVDTILFEVQTSVNASVCTLESEQLYQSQIHYWTERIQARLSLDFENLDDHSASIYAQAHYMIEFQKTKRAVILVVDDHEPAVRIIQRYLIHSNLQVIGVTDPTRVLAIAKKNRPKAILLDVMMPTMDGWEILQQIRADAEIADTAVIVCSVWNQPDFAFSLGANGFLKKPIKEAELAVELVRLNLMGTWGELHPPDY